MPATQTGPPRLPDLRPPAPRRRPRTHADLCPFEDCLGRLHYLRLTSFRIRGRGKLPWARTYRCGLCDQHLNVEIHAGRVYRLSSPHTQEIAAGTGRRRGHAGRRDGRT